MNAATEFDLGPLTWVKGEIDQALQKAGEALAQYAAQADVTQLKFCRTHLHQAHGALDMVGLAGVTAVSESVEALLLAVEDGRAPGGDSLSALLGQAISALRQYLDDLLAGAPNQPLRLHSTLAALASARGLPEPHSGELFYPDLTLRPPKRAADNIIPGSDQLAGILKNERRRFQTGLLSWLKKPDEAESGRRLMREAVAVIESVQPTPVARTFWWVSLAFLDAMADPTLAADPVARQLCSRIDAQIRRLLDGSNSVAERVLREALFYVARVPAELSPVVAEVQQTYGLKELLPAAAEAVLEMPQEGALRRLRDSLASAEESWNKFCTGNTASLSGFCEAARACAQLTEAVGQTDLKRLGQGLGAIANWLSEDPARFGDMVAMEIATTILLMQNAQENFKRLGTDFAQQVDLMVARLYACIAGRPASDEAIPVLDEMTRRAQEKLLIGQVGREIQNNLAQVEQVLDAYFRDPAKAPDLAQVESPLKQIGGALAMLGHFGAVNSLKECGARIQQFAQPDYQAAEADFEAIASQLSLLGFFVDALAGGEADYDAFVFRMQGKPDAEGASEDIAEPVPADTVEVQLAQQAKETQALAEALREAPEDARLQDELKQNLTAIQKDADLVANRVLGDSARAALAALQTGGGVDAALAGLAPVKAEAPQPTAETLQLAESDHAAIDAELLGIFLEEAREVLAAMSEQKALLVANPANGEALTVIRRSTHTLKGSGRMVGLSDLGEAAWACEQTLNLWLRQDQAVAPELLEMIEAEHSLFSEWIHHLESGQGRAPDPAALVALAGRLRGVEVAVDVPPAAAPEPAVLAEPPIELIEAAPEPVLDILTEPELAALVPEPVAQPVEIDIVKADEPVVDVMPLSLDEAPELTDLSVTLAEGPDAVIEMPDDRPVAAEAPAEEKEPEVAQAITVSPTLYDIFREEARGHLQVLVEQHALLDADPGAPTAFAMTRAAHTLGGIAATVGLMPINRLAIALEHTLLRRDGSAHPASIEGLETVRQSIMMLESMFEGLALQRAPEDQPQQIAALEDVFHPAPAELVDSTQQATESAEIISLAEHSFASAIGVGNADAAPAESVASAAAPELPLLTDEFDEQLLPIFLEEAVDLTRGLTTQLHHWRNDTAGDAAPHAIARLLHTFKGSARMAGAMNLGEATHLLEARVEEALRAGTATAAFIDEIEAGCDTLALAVERLREAPAAPEILAIPVEVAEAGVTVPTPATAVPVLPAEPEAEGEATGQRATLRVRADLVDRLVNEAGELSIARTRIEGEMRSLKTSLLELTENVIRLRRQLREIEIQAETQIQAKVVHAPEGNAEFDPLELDRFTRFQELTRFMAESVNDVATVQQNLLKNLDDANAAILSQARLNRSLQQELMSVRMVPFASQAERLFRIVRQTAKEVGKRANLDIVGGQVDIDRSVLDKMMAPLEHMLRNAVTHGIEDKAQRAAAGKDEAGEILVKLAQEGNEIILTMADDGRGLDRARIQARGEAMALLTPGQDADDATLFDLIFQPGFSTAAELTQLSGRGVGMDVVKTEVAALGGRIETMSQPGQGTTFRLYLPLTLAVTQTLLVRVGSQIYALPSTMIEQVMEVKERVLDGIRDKAEVSWQDNRYPFHFLPHLLGDLQAVPEAHRLYWVLLLRSGSQRVAVLVDELKGNQEAVVKNIGAQLARVVGIAGATVLGDGRVVLILNPVALASKVQASTAHLAVPTMAPPVLMDAKRQPTVMIVDDSLTVRKITSRLMAREGYQVMLAKDGVDALEQLVDTLPDIILSDVEMPRMDGFDLVRNVRADERLRSLPIAMITSRTADKHRNYALEIGANYYLGKPYDEVELLRIVEQHCKKA